VLRDIVCNEIPSAFRDHRPYAICSFAGAWVTVAAQQLELSHSIGLVLAAGTATLLRAAALWTGYTLPSWQAGGPER